MSSVPTRRLRLHAGKEGHALGRALFPSVGRCNRGQPVALLFELQGTLGKLAGPIDREVGALAGYHGRDLFHTLLSHGLGEDDRLLEVLIVQLIECGSRPLVQGVGYVPELFGITHDIDRDDAAILDVQGGCLENRAALDGDESRQAVDEAIAYEARPVRREDRCEIREQAHGVVESSDRRAMNSRLSTAIGVDGDVHREQHAQALHLAVARRGEEGRRDLEATFLWDRIAGTVCTNMSASATSELATRS